MDAERMNAFGVTPQDIAGALKVSMPCSRPAA